jgi:hypothetical protein
MNFLRKTALRLFYIQFTIFKNMRFIYKKIHFNFQIYEQFFKISMNIKTEEELNDFLKKVENIKIKTLDEKRGKHMKEKHKKAKELYMLNPEKTYHQCLRKDADI